MACLYKEINDLIFRKAKIFSQILSLRRMLFSIYSYKNIHIYISNVIYVLKLNGKVGILIIWNRASNEWLNWLCWPASYVPVTLNSNVYRRFPKNISPQKSGLFTPNIKTFPPSFKFLNISLKIWYLYFISFCCKYK